MSRRILAVDPGTRVCGWVIFGEDGAGQVGIVRSVAETLPERAAEMAAALYKSAGKYKATEIVVEMPRVYRTGKQKGDPNDIVDLAFVAGAVAIVLAAVGQWATTPTPREWKGTVPKHTHHARLREICPEAVSAIDKIPKSLQHNAWDAVGLGLWALRKGEIN